MAQELTRESTTLYDGARSLVSIAKLIDKGAERFFLIQARQDMSEEQQEDTPQSLLLGVKGHKMSRRAGCRATASRSQRSCGSRLHGPPIKRGRRTEGN